MSPEQRTALLLNQGIADPNANYFTPDWPGGSRPANEYTGIPDTGFRNTFGVDHDINANSTYLGYFDIFTPLFGTNELEIGAGGTGEDDNVNMSSIWSSILDTIMSGWSWLTSLFQDAFTSYNETGSYDDSGSGDSGFYDFLDGGGDYGGGDYGGDGGGGGGGGGEEELEEEAF